MIKRFRLGRIFAVLKTAMDRAAAPQPQAVPPRMMGNNSDGPRYVPRNRLLIWREDDYPNSKRYLVPVPVEEQKQSPKLIGIHMVVEYGEELYEVRMLRDQNELISDFNEKLRYKLNGFKEKHNGIGLPPSPCPSPGRTSPSFTPLPRQEYDYSLLHLYADQSFKHAMVFGRPLEVIRNPPSINRVTIAFSTHTGTIMMPSPSLQADDDYVYVKEWTWWVGRAEAMQSITVHREKDDSELYIYGWEKVHTGCFYELPEEHVQKNLVVVADLGPNSVAHAHKVMQRISAPEDKEYIFLERQNDCVEETKDGVYRIVGYNVLADLYNRSRPTEKRPSIYPYCQYSTYTAANRYPVLLKELKGYNADMFYLQEVDKVAYNRYLKHFFNELGLDSRYLMKGSKETTPEGVVIAFKKDKFEFQWEERKWLPDYASDDRNKDIINLLNKGTDLFDLFMKRNTCCLIVVLKEKRTGKPVIAANTHLYFNPQHQHVKMLQAVLCARLIASVKKRVIAQGGWKEEDVRTLFGGDFNSVPRSAVVEFFSTGSVAETNECWTDSPAYGAFEMEQPPYRSLCGYPEYTNVTEHEIEQKKAGFNGCLDYLWGCKNVVPEKVIPLPREELVKRYVGLPSHIAPSDHLALVCEVRFEE